MAGAKKRSAIVLYNSTPAGVLTKTGALYYFVYNQNYLENAGSRPVSITLPLQPAPYESDVLFPVFINMLSEGANKHVQCRLLKIDENDYFSLLLATAKDDSIGPITIQENNEPS